MKELVTVMKQLESGTLEDQKALELFSTLIKGGLIGSLPETYSLYAQILISLGLLTEEGDITEKGEEL